MSAEGLEALVDAREPMRDHWWWRPGWRTGRSFYTWHVTFADEPEMERLIEDYKPVLAGLPSLDPVPRRWMHLTMQGLGFADEVADDDVRQIVEAARGRCAGLEPFEITIGPAHVDPETIQMPVRPVEPLLQLRDAIRDAIADIWGAGGVPERADGYRPHVSLGYSNRACDAGPLVDALAEHGEHEARVMVRAASLIDLNRDNRMYEWSDVADVEVGKAIR